jgi:hypothetical protein
MDIVILGVLQTLFCPAILPCDSLNRFGNLQIEWWVYSYIFCIDVLTSSSKSRKQGTGLSIGQALTIGVHGFINIQFSSL